LRLIIWRHDEAWLCCEGAGINPDFKNALKLKEILLAEIANNNQKKLAYLMFDVFHADVGWFKTTLRERTLYGFGVRTPETSNKYKKQMFCKFPKKSFRMKYRESGLNRTPYPDKGIRDDRLKLRK